MDIKTIKVQKNGVIKEIEASQEKDYAKNGWTIVKKNPYEYSNPSYKK